MWNIKDINQKKNYVIERLKNCKDPKEKEKLELSLITYESLLNNSGTLRYTGLYNAMDRLTQNKYSEMKNQSIAEMEIGLFFKDTPLMSDEYLQFLLDICNNIAETPYADFNEEDMSTFETDYESIVNMSHSFYNELGDQEILSNAEKLFNDESSINDSKMSRIGMADCSGLTFDDYYFGKAYVNITRKNNIFDYQVLNHEIMHGIDFYMQNKVPSESYYGFHEVPTYTIDYLFIDYLGSKGIDSNEIQKLRNKKDNYLQELAKLTQTQIKSALVRNKKYQDATIEDIKQVLEPQLIKQLLELESGVIAYGLYNQIKSDREKGITNLKLAMKEVLPKQQIPNFSFIELDNTILLELSKQIGTYSMNSEMNIQEIDGFSK